MNDHAKRRQPLPPRDTSRNDTEQGLFQKFIVTRTDGSSGPGGKHELCEYFVLDIDHDPHAMPALEAYARACASTHPELAVDLQQRYGLPVDATMPLSREQVLRRRAHAVGIARDIADAFSTDRSDGASTSSLLRQLADELLNEPELVRAIAAWHQAEQRMVDGTPPGCTAESDRSISDRARGLLAKLEALGIRSVLSAHHEEWWRIHGDHERLQREVLQVLHDGLRARQRASDRLLNQRAGMNLSQDESEVLTVPVVSKFGDHEPIGWLKVRQDKLPPTPNYVFSLGFMALENVADAPGSVPSKGYVGAYKLLEIAITSDASYIGYLRQTGVAAKGPSVHATPVLLETTALWAGAKMGEADGVSFTSEQWAKFVQCLGAEPPLELMTSPGVSAPESVLHQRCIERGGQEALPCPSGKCAMGEPR